MVVLISLVEEFQDNIARIIPNKLCAEIFLNKIKPTKIFRWLKK